MAAHVHAGAKHDAAPARAVLPERRCGCGGVVSRLTGECPACRARRLATYGQGLASPQQAASAAKAPPIVNDVLRSTGRPLDASTQAFAGGRLGHDFASVRVHTDSRAADSARAMEASAYTVGRHVVFGAGHYAPESRAGRALLLHELTHVVQQRGRSSGSQLRIGPALDRHEREADRVASGRARPSAGTAVRSVQRQFVTPLAPGGGYRGLMERDRQRAYGPPSVVPGPSTPFKVCSRPLQGFLGGWPFNLNHAYVEAPPNRYAIISPLCPASSTDNPVTGTTAQKWDNSPDPCGKTPACVDCVPKSGVSDVAACFRSAFTAYAALSLYKGTGPNSNTFAGTLARTCCDGMVPKPAALGTCPGWDDPPAAARAGGTPCPPGPTC